MRATRGERAERELLRGSERDLDHEGDTRHRVERVVPGLDRDARVAEEVRIVGLAVYHVAVDVEDLCSRRPKVRVVLLGRFPRPSQTILKQSLSNGKRHLKGRLIPSKERAGVTEAVEEGRRARQDGQEDRAREVAAARSRRGRSSGTIAIVVTPAKP